MEMSYFLLRCDLCCSMFEDVVRSRVRTAMARGYKGTLIVVKKGYVSYTK